VLLLLLLLPLLLLLLPLLLVLLPLLPLCATIYHPLADVPALS
jgi:hypothetical protein